MTGMEESAEHHHFWVQAPVPALDVDGLAVVTVGTVIFALASVALAIGYDWLVAHGHVSWLQISVAGLKAEALLVQLTAWETAEHQRVTHPGGKPRRGAQVDVMIAQVADDAIQRSSAHLVCGIG